MATQVFSDKVLERLRRFRRSVGTSCSGLSPRLQRMSRLSILTGGRGPADRLGLPVALCTLPWLGFVPDQVSGVTVARLADQLNLNPGELRSYGR